MLHASAVSLDGEGLLFAGVSGAGKSTLASIMEANLGAAIVSDDRVAVSRRCDGYAVSGTPWHSRNLSVSPLSVPLKHLFFLEHAEANQAAPLSPMQAATEAYQQTAIPYWHRDGVRALTALIADLSKDVPAHRLGFVPDSTTADYVRCLLES